MTAGVIDDQAARLAAPAGTLAPGRIRGTIEFGVVRRRSDSVAVMTITQVSATVRIGVAPDEVWTVLTADRATWWPEMVFDARVGAPLVETWIDGGELHRASGVVTVAAPPALLGFEWREPGWLAPLSVLVRIAPVDGGGTEATITESGFAQAGTPDGLPFAHEEGWRHHLGRLRAACEAGANP